jgi:hypothetical protein
MQRDISHRSGRETNLVTLVEGQTKSSIFWNVNGKVFVRYVAETRHQRNNEISVYKRLIPVDRNRLWAPAEHRRVVGDALTLQDPCQGFEVGFIVLRRLGADEVEEFV